MRLITLHKVLIGSFSAFALFFGLRELMRSDVESNAAVAIAALLLACIGIAYFIWVVRGGYKQ